jgi:hypothetical protein
MDGQSDVIGVNALDAVAVAPGLVRIEMVRKERTYELLITGPLEPAKASDPS